MRIDIKPGLRIGIDGWVEANESWSYSTWDDTNGVSTATITVPSDARTKYQAGMRVKFTQPTDGVKYGIITKVAETTLTVFINTDYDFDNEAITSPFYSPMKAPFGFDCDPEKYKVENTDVTSRTQASPTQNTWYNLGTQSIDIPIGKWNVEYFVCAYSNRRNTNNTIVETTLSTANNSESDSDFTCYTQAVLPITTVDNEYHYHIIPMYVSKVLGLTTKATYYLNTRTTQTGGTTLGNANNVKKLFMRARCAYL